MICNLHGTSGAMTTGTFSAAKTTSAGSCGRQFQELMMNAAVSGVVENAGTWASVSIPKYKPTSTADGSVLKNLFKSGPRWSRRRSVCLAHCGPVAVKRPPHSLRGTRRHRQSPKRCLIGPKVVQMVHTWARQNQFVWPTFTLVFIGFARGDPDGPHEIYFL